MDLFLNLTLLLVLSGDIPNVYLLLHSILSRIHHNRTHCTVHTEPCNDTRSKIDIWTERYFLIWSYLQMGQSI